MLSCMMFCILRGLKPFEMLFCSKDKVHSHYISVIVLYFSNVGEIMVNLYIYYKTIDFQYFTAKDAG